MAVSLHWWNYHHQHPQQFSLEQVLLHNRSLVQRNHHFQRLSHSTLLRIRFQWRLEVQWWPLTLESVWNMDHGHKGTNQYHHYLYWLLGHTKIMHMIVEGGMLFIPDFWWEDFFLINFKLFGIRNKNWLTLNRLEHVRHLLDSRIRNKKHTSCSI